jgi:glyoxylase-like metal-dependent hydrolase (beta-lactamase superfamily II)
MNGPTMFEPRDAAPDTSCLPSYLPIPGHGVLAINSFIIKGTEPVLVDTGLAALREPFMAALGKVIDPADLRWIWISHTDADHLGNLDAVLKRAPRAKVVTNFVGMAKMMLLGHDVSRVHMLETGTSLDAGDRTLVPFRPPVYDAPETMGFVDTATRVLFSADAFGALLPNAVESAGAISQKDLRNGMGAWTAIDAPWLGNLQTSAFARNLARIERLDPVSIISGHLPPGNGMNATLLRNLAEVQASGPTDGPDHELLDQLVAQSAIVARAVG